MTWYLPTRGPLFWDELRRRLRNTRGYTGLALFVLALAPLLVWDAARQQGALSLGEWPTHGRMLWRLFETAQLLLVALISPGMTAGAIAGERERGTMDLLLLTPLDARDLVLGKCLGALGHLAYILAAGVPVMGVIVGVYGGVSPFELVFSSVVVVEAGLFYLSLGLLASCLCQGTGSATFWAYAFLFLSLTLAPVGWVFPVVIRMADPQQWVLLLLPAVAVPFMFIVVVLHYCITCIRRLRDGATWRRPALPYVPFATGRSFSGGVRRR